MEREFDGSGYGDFKAAVADAVVEYLAPVRERYGELRGDEAALEATLAAGADKARDRVGHPRRRARGDGRGRAALTSTVSPMRTAELQLDLDTFSGPFDLLLTLVLREEINLMDVDLGDVVIAYVEHLERTGSSTSRPRPSSSS